MPQHAPRRVSRNDWWKAIRTSHLSPQARLLAMILSSWMNADGSRCYPGQDALATACGWSGARTVRRALAELEDTGYLEIERYAGVRQPGRSQSTHRYWPTAPGGRPTGRTRPTGPGDQPDTSDRLEPVENPRPAGHSRPGANGGQPRPVGHLGQTSRSPVSDNQSRDQSRETHPARARDAPAAPVDNGRAAGGGKKLWSQVVDHLASRNGKVGRAIASDRPADRGKLVAALDAAAAAGVTAGALRRLADEPPLDDPKIRSVSATLAGRIRHHLEDLEHAHG